MVTMFNVHLHDFLEWRGVQVVQGHQAVQEYQVLHQFQQDPENPLGNKMQHFNISVRRQ